MNGSNNGAADGLRVEQQDPGNTYPSILCWKTGLGGGAIRGQKTQWKQPLELTTKRYLCWSVKAVLVQRPERRGLD